jgi:ABC-type enterochelin transport system permease subunit
MAQSPFNTPRKIAFFTASSVSVIMAILIFVFLFLTDGQFNYWLLLVGPVIGFFFQLYCPEICSRTLHLRQNKNHLQNHTQQ